jgi:hypothetical protein
MNREQTKQAISVMQDWLNSATVECRLLVNDPIKPGYWVTMLENESPSWNFVTHEYRIKPKEPREFWIPEDMISDAWHDDGLSIEVREITDD